MGSCRASPDGARHAPNGYHEWNQPILTSHKKGNSKCFTDTRSQLLMDTYLSSLFFRFFLFPSFFCPFSSCFYVGFSAGISVIGKLEKGLSAFLPNWKNSFSRRHFALKKIKMQESLENKIRTDRVEKMCRGSRSVKCWIEEVSAR